MKTAKITKGDIARITLTVCQCAAEYKVTKILRFRFCLTVAKPITTVTKL